MPENMPKNMKVLGVISARAGSKGLPGKNLRPLGGHPLMAHMIMAAQKATLIDRLILTTEDDEIADVGRSYGIEVPFKRPAKLANDQATGIQVTKHSMEAMDELGYRADIILHLFPTCPFIKPESIDKAVRLVLEGYDSAIAVQDSSHFHPYRAVLFEDGDRIKAFLDDPVVEKPVNRQDLPDIYVRCGAIFTRRRELLEQWDEKDFCLGKERGGVLLSEIEAVNIDNESDFLFAEFIAQKNLNS